MHKAYVWVATARLMGSARPHGHEIRLKTRSDYADLTLQAEGAGAAEGGKREHLYC
jgi:hypothetical protein